MTPAYQFNVGEVIETRDDRIGIIIDKTDAFSHMAMDLDFLKITDRTINSYRHIAIYKVMIDSNITYVNESNIRRVVIECLKKNM